MNLQEPISGACRVCEGGLQFSFTAREMQHGTREKFGYSTCVQCGCLQIDEIPDGLDRFYPDDYYTRSSIRRVSSRRMDVPAIRQLWSRLRLAGGPFLRPFAGRRFGRFDWFTRTTTKLDDAILDVGCGSGRLLWNMHREGFGRLTGIDPNLREVVETGEGPKFLSESLEAHQGRYWLVMSHHSFEHVTNPRSAFRAFSRLVEPGGWLLLRIPMADGWACRHYGADWVQLDAPRHLHLHTRRSIEWLCADFGFQTIAVVDDSGPFQIWGSELYRRDIPLVEGTRQRRAQRALGTALATRLRTAWLRAMQQGDQVCFYLQRSRAMKDSAQSQDEEPN